MSIKVKNEGNVASRLAGAASGGQAKREMEAAAFAKGPTIQQKQAASVSAGAAPSAHAQLINAPGGQANAAPMYGGGGIGNYRIGNGSIRGDAKSYPKDDLIPFENQMIVTKTRVNENQRWDDDLKAYVGRPMTGQMAAYNAEQMRSVLQPWEAALIGAKNSADINSMAAKTAISMNATPKVSNGLIGAYDRTVRSAIVAANERANRMWLPTVSQEPIPNPYQTKGIQSVTPPVFKYYEGQSYEDAMNANSGYNDGLSSYDDMVGIMDVGLYGYLR